MLDRRTFSNLAPALVVIFIDNTSRSGAYPVLIFLMSVSSSFLPHTTTFRERLLYLSLLFMLNPLFKFIGSNYLGSLSDIIKRKKTLFITTSGLTISLLLCGFSVILKSITLLIIAISLRGLFGASRTIALASMMDSCPKKERARAFAIANFAFAFGAVCGPLIGGFFSDRQLSPAFTPELPFFIASLLSCLSILWIAFGFRETYGNKLGRKWSVSELYAPFVHAIRHKASRLLLPQTIFIGIAFSLFQFSVWDQLSHVIHVSTLTLGYYIGGVGCVGLLAALFVVAPITKVMCTEKLLTWTLICMIGVFIVQAVFHSLTAFWAFLIPLGTLQISFYTCCFANMSHSVGKHHQGWAMGALSGAFSIAWLIGSLCLNLLGSLSFADICYICAGLATISLLLLLWHRGIFHPKKLEEEIEPMDS